jgi:hypothetical protein
MGVVWRARDTLLGREVAIKEVRLPATVPDSERSSLRARVLREARAAARLNHPGAVTLAEPARPSGPGARPAGSADPARAVRERAAGPSSLRPVPRRHRHGRRRRRRGPRRVRAAGRGRRTRKERPAARPHTSRRDDPAQRNRPPQCGLRVQRSGPPRPPGPPAPRQLPRAVRPRARRPAPARRRRAGSLPERMSRPDGRPCGSPMGATRSPTRPDGTPRHAPMA